MIAHKTRVPSPTNAISSTLIVVTEGVAMSVGSVPLATELIKKMTESKHNYY